MGDTIKLSELEPKFIKYIDEKTFQFVDDVAQAQGVEFLCPKCFQENKGNVGTHAVLCWSRSAGVPDTAEPGPGRWRLVGTGLHDLSLMEEPGKSRSVLLLGDGCKAHFFVTNGEITF